LRWLKPRQGIASGKWADDCVNALAGRDCWIIQDVDINGAGDRKARDIADRLHGVARSIKVVRLPGLTGDHGNKDVSDWLGLTRRFPIDIGR
jgi:hypothetical protein